MEIQFFKRREEPRKRKIEYEAGTYLGYCRTCGVTLITLSPKKDVFRSLQEIERAVNDHNTTNGHEALIGKLLHEGTSAIKIMGTHISEFETLPTERDF